MLKFAIFYTFWNYLRPYFNLILTLLCSLFDTGHYMILKFVIFFTFWNYLCLYFNLILIIICSLFETSILLILKFVFFFFFTFINYLRYYGSLNLAIISSRNLFFFLTWWNYMCSYFNLMLTMICWLVDKGHYRLLKFVNFFSIFEIFCVLILT